MRLIKLKAMKRINALHFTPDGRKLLAVGGAEVRMQDWAVWVDIGEMAETVRVPMHAGCAAVSADGTRIAAGNPRPFLDQDTDIPPVVVFDASDPTWHEDKSRWQTVIREGSNYLDVGGLAFDPSGKRLAVSYAVTNLRGRSARTTSAFKVLALGKGKSFDVPPGDDPDISTSVFAFSPDGKRLAASGGIDGEPNVLLVNTRTADRVSEFTPPGPKTLHLIFSPDGGTLAVTNGKTVFLHVGDSDDAKFSLAHPKQVNAVAFTPDGARLLSVCHDSLVRIWDVATGQVITSFDFGIGQTTALSVSPDGTTATAAGQKGQITVFDLG